MEGGEPRDGDDFWHFNTFVGYRFLENRAEVSVGLLNLGDQDYRLDPINPYRDIPRRRTALLRTRITF